jgi:hypothetical protein
MTRGVRIRTDRVFLRRDRGRTFTDMPAIALRQATSHDHDELVRLAALDCAEPLQGDVLLGRVNGQLRAALSRSDGRVVADPFCYTAQLVALLRTWNYSY